MRGPVTALGLTTVLAVGACAPEEYDDSRACHGPADLIGSAVGTMAFTAEENDVDLPLGSGPPTGGNLGGWYLCRVDVDGERAVVVDARIESDDVISTRERVIREGDGFEHANGIRLVRVDGAELDGMWICGEVSVTVQGEDAEGDADAVEELVKTVADQAGCWRSGP